MAVIFITVQFFQRLLSLPSSFFGGNLFYHPIFLMGMGHYFENKVEVIGFASPRIGKVLKFRGHEAS